MIQRGKYIFLILGMIFIMTGVFLLLNKNNDNGKHLIVDTSKMDYKAIDSSHVKEYQIDSYLQDYIDDDIDEKLKNRYIFPMESTYESVIVQDANYKKYSNNSNDGSVIVYIDNIRTVDLIVENKLSYYESLGNFELAMFESTEDIDIAGHHASYLKIAAFQDKHQDENGIYPPTYIEEFTVLIKENTQKNVVISYIIVNKKFTDELLSQIVMQMNVMGNIEIEDENKPDDEPPAEEPSIDKPSEDSPEEPPEEEINKDPLVYIYNTHQGETYLGSREINLNYSVLDASHLLKEKLENYDIYSIVENNSIEDVLYSNNWKYAASYVVSRMYLENASRNYSSLKYFIDLHRDSVNKSISTAYINGKSYARILFVLGLENGNYHANNNVLLQLNSWLNANYPGISRGIYGKQGAWVNGVYNQDFSEHCILIEVGGQDNTLEEVENTIEVVALMLSEYIKSR